MRDGESLCRLYSSSLILISFINMF